MPEAVFHELLRRAGGDERAVGVVVGGSRGRGIATADSDWDVYVFVEDDADQHAVRDSLDVIEGPVELCDVQRLSVFASSDGVPAWNRYTFAHVTPSLDRTDGVLQRLCDGKERLENSDATPLASQWLEAYVNSCYRSLKNHRVGNTAAARLDAAESVNALLEFVFAAEGRVRPYNKYLEWELEEHPLQQRWWRDDQRPVPTLLEMVTSGSPALQAAMFRSIETQARSAGHATQLDGWGDALNMLRSPEGRQF